MIQIAPTVKTLQFGMNHMRSWGTALTRLNENFEQAL